MNYFDCWSGCLSAMPPACINYVMIFQKQRIIIWPDPQDSYHGTPLWHRQITFCKEHEATGLYVPRKHVIFISRDIFFGYVFLCFCCALILLPMKKTTESFRADRHMYRSHVHLITFLIFSKELGSPGGGNYWPKHSINTI